MLSNRKTLIKWVALAVLLCATFFVNNRVIAPDIMECRNLVTAREMVSGTATAECGYALIGGQETAAPTWLVPTMNGELRMEKPPLPTWFAAVGEIVSPDNLTLQRGIAGAAAVMLVAFVVLTARRLLDFKESWIPLVLLCTCYSVILMGRTATWDIFCHAFMMGAIYFLVRSRDANKPLLSFAIAGLFAGLSIMSKGPVALYALLLPFLISYFVVSHAGHAVAFPRLAGHTRSTLWRGFALFVVVMLVVGTWWYVAVYLVQPDAMAAVSGKEAGAWVNHNVRPWWYYRTFPLETGVWAVLLVTSLVAPLFDKRLLKDKSYALCALWTVVTVVLLSLFPEKKNRYLFPMLIPASLTMACLVATQWRFRASRAIGCDRWLFRLNAAAIALCVLVLPVAAYLFIYKEGALSTLELVAWTVFFVAVAAVLVVAAVRLRPKWMLAAVAVLFVVAECFALPHLDVVINNVEKHSIALLRHDTRAASLPMFHDSRAPLRIELVYAAGRQIRPLTLTSIDSLRRHLPCIVLTHGDVSASIPAAVLEQLDTLRLDRFDDNPRPRGTRRYSDDFIYTATVLRLK